ncbi:MAG: ATP-binding protein [Candidatus Nitrosopelagicus sp.]|nr:ATP-binding protein [Candidatus Nitrosopelagicus sp.]
MMDEKAKYPSKVKEGDHVLYARRKQDPEDLWIAGFVDKKVSDQDDHVETGTACYFTDGYFGYVQKFVSFQQMSESSILDLIKRKEGNEIERKASFYVDKETGTVKTWLPDQVVKEVAAFLNTEGGHIVIGVKDEDGSIVGIEDDLIFVENTLKDPKDIEDKYVSQMEDYIFKKLNDSRLNTHVKITVPDFLFDGKKICLIKVTKCQSPPALIDLNVQIVNTNKDHFNEKDLFGKPSIDSEDKHIWKNTNISPSVYYVRLNQKTVHHNIRNLFKTIE